MTATCTLDRQNYNQCVHYLKVYPDVNLYIPVNFIFPFMHVNSPTIYIILKFHKSSSARVYFHIDNNVTEFI